MNEAEAKTLVLNVLSTIAPEADLGALPDDAILREDLDLDFMDFLNFISSLHKKTKIDIPEADYPKLFTLAGAVGYLCR